MKNEKQCKEKCKTTQEKVKKCEKTSNFYQKSAKFEFLDAEQKIKTEGEYSLKQSPFTKSLKIELNRKINSTALENASKKSAKSVGEKTLDKFFFSSKDKFEFVALVKTFLCIYNTLPNIIKIVDSVIESRAMSGFDINGSSLNEMEKMIDMSERKVRLLVLQDEVKNMLKILDADEKKLAILRFSKNVPIAKLQERFNIPLRCLYRKINAVVFKICAGLLKRGETLISMHKKIANEPWIIAYFEQIFEKQKSDELRKAKRK